MALPKDYVSPIVPVDRDRILRLADDPTYELSSIEQAMLMVIEVEDALSNGVKHYSKEGEYLDTPQKILTALNRDGEITFAKPEEQMN